MQREKEAALRLPQPVEDLLRADSEAARAATQLRQSPTGTAESQKDPVRLKEAVKGVAPALEAALRSTSDLPTADEEPTRSFPAQTDDADTPTADSRADDSSLPSVSLSQSQPGAIRVDGPGALRVSTSPTPSSAASSVAGEPETNGDVQTNEPPIAARVARDVEALEDEVIFLRRRLLEEEQLRQQHPQSSVSADPNRTALAASRTVAQAQAVLAEESGCCVIL